MGKADEAIGAAVQTSTVAKLSPRNPSSMATVRASSGATTKR